MWLETAVWIVVYSWGDPTVRSLMGVVPFPSGPWQPCRRRWARSFPRPSPRCKAGLRWREGAPSGRPWASVAGCPRPHLGPWCGSWHRKALPAVGGRQNGRFGFIQIRIMTLHYGWSLFSTAYTYWTQLLPKIQNDPTIWYLAHQWIESQKHLHQPQTGSVSTCSLAGQLHSLH